MEVKIDNILRTFKTELEITQPVFEAIANSFEAKSTIIDIVFHKKENLEDADYVDYIEVIDNGDGFTKENIDSFCEYLSDYKLQLGCKGIGRFTWLKVFRTIEVESYTGNSIVKFKFDRYFKPGDINPVPTFDARKQTIIRFKDLNEKYIYSKINVAKFKRQVLDYFMLTFINYKNNNSDFKINLKYENKSDSITLKDIDDLHKKSFKLYSQFDRTEYEFKLLYNFIDKTNKAQNECFLCGNRRTVEKYELKNIFSHLPDNKIIKVLVFSRYFDNRVNDERTSFTFSKSENNPNISNPLPFTLISDKLNEVLSNIILNEFPNIKETNKEIIEACLSEKPYLSKYINKDNTLIKNKNDVLNNAQKQFEKEKEEVKKNFSKILEDKSVSSDELIKEFEKMNELSNRELAQYFIFRQVIINALKKLDDDNQRIEKFLHNLFFDMGNISSGLDSFEKKYRNCIWLLDDKYMSYERCYSDTKISKIKEEIKLDSPKYYGAKEPDLTIFYSNHDIVVVEFKAIGANVDDKFNAIPEIDRNIGIIAKQFKEINNIYGYIITKFNDEFKDLIKYSHGIKPLFSTGKDPIYFYSNDNIVDADGNKVNTFVNFISTETIYCDANQRNKLFIDIINNK